ncbi:MAG: hypothetical protein HQL50_12700 [Magnetococcales bacterium]|nr:hypothetical protein [Magnetococcales bacterium]
MRIETIESFDKEGSHKELNVFDMDMNPFVGLVAVTLAPLAAVVALLWMFG